MGTRTHVYGYGFCMGASTCFVFKSVYSYNNIKINYLVFKKINNTVENEHTSSFLRVEGGGGGGL